MNKWLAVKNFVKFRWLLKFKDRQQLERYQQKKLARHLKFIRTHSPYFREMNMDSFEAIPYMNKQIMMDNFNQLNTVGIDKEQALELAIHSEKTREFQEKLQGISVGLSSGTSGHRGLFIVSDDEIATWVGGIMAKLLPSHRLLNHKVAFFLRADNNLYEGAKSRVLDFKYFDISKSMEEQVEILQQFQPTILIAPPSVLMILAKSVENNKLSIQPIKVISVAEVLTQEDSEYFRRIFKQPFIHQVYQCTEGFLGYTCECGSFHLNEDIAYIEKEYVDERRFIPIITDFVRSSQPIVRYRLNDILVESDKKCPCGSALMVIEKIEGRMDDVFLFDTREGKEISVFPDYISRCVIYVPDIKEYRVYQKSKTEIIVYIDCVTEQVQTQIRKEFETLFDKFNIEEVNIVFDTYTTNLLRKMKRVERGF
ncbi:CoF synthetase [Aerococcaceae bacterium NML180378]|nr:CoF synthetase [Aerococcaceae bacterium NML180378]